MNLTEFVLSIAAEIRAALPPEVIVTTDATEVRPALEDGHLVAWILPPSSADYLTSEILEFTLEPIVIGPTSGDPLIGLAEVEPIAREIGTLTQAEKIRFDSIQLGASEYYPAAQLTITTTL